MMVRVYPTSSSVNRNMELSAYPLPDELAEHLATTTGPDGQGAIAGVAPADLAGVAIEAHGFGRQLAKATSGSDGGFVFRVAPVGRLAGRIVVDDPRATPGAQAPSVHRLHCRWARRIEREDRGGARLVGPVRGPGAFGRHPATSRSRCPRSPR